MTLHHRNLSAADIAYGPTKDQDEFTSFARNATMRASTGNLKQPRLPGSEKFKFARAGNRQVAHLPLNASRSSTLPSGRKSQLMNNLSGASLSSYAFSDSKRKPILPISRNTSRVLNNTNVELTADTVEIIPMDNVGAHMCQKYLHNGADHAEDSTSDDWSRSSSDQSLERDGRYRHTIILQPQRSIPEKTNPGLSHREMNNNVGHFATIRSNRLHTRTPRVLSSSASQSTISSDEDVWVMRS